MASSVRLLRSSLGTPQASYSSISSPPKPTAGKQRPWDRKSRVAICLARTTGFRRGRGQDAGAELHPVGPGGHHGKGHHGLQAEPVVTMRSLSQMES